MSEPRIHPTPEFRRFMARSPQEHREAIRRVMAQPLVAAVIAKSGPESVGVVAARIVDRLRLMAWLHKDGA